MECQLQGSHLIHSSLIKGLAGRNSGTESCKDKESAAAGSQQGVCWAERTSNMKAWRGTALAQSSIKRKAVGEIGYGEQRQRRTGIVQIQRVGQSHFLPGLSLEIWGWRSCKLRKTMCSVWPRLMVDMRPQEMSSKGIEASIVYKSGPRLWRSRRTSTYGTHHSAAKIIKETQGQTSL